MAGSCRLHNRSSQSILAPRNLSDRCAHAAFGLQPCGRCRDPRDVSAKKTILAFVDKRDDAENFTCNGCSVISCCNLRKRLRSFGFRPGCSDDGVFGAVGSVSSIRSLECVHMECPQERPSLCAPACCRKRVGRFCSGLGIMIWRSPSIR